MLKRRCEIKVQFESGATGVQVRQQGGLRTLSTVASTVSLVRGLGKGVFGLYLGRSIDRLLLSVPFTSFWSAPCWCCVRFAGPFVDCVANLSVVS